MVFSQRLRSAPVRVSPAPWRWAASRFAVVALLCVWGASCRCGGGGDPASGVGAAAGEGGGEGVPDAGEAGEAASLGPAPVYPTAYKPTDPTGDFVLRRAQLRVATAEGHRRVDALADLDALHHLLTRGHIGLALADEATRRRWTQAMIDARQALQGRDVITNAELFALLRVHLGPLTQRASPVLWADRGQGRVAVRLGHAGDVSALDIALDPEAREAVLAPGAAPTPDMEGARLERCTGPLERPAGPTLTAPKGLREALPPRVSVWDAARGGVVARPLWEGPAGLDFRCRFTLPNGSARVVQVASKALAEPDAPTPPGAAQGADAAQDAVQIEDHAPDGAAPVRVVRVRALVGGDPEQLGALRRAGERAAAAERAVVDLRGVSRGDWAGAEAFAAPWFYGDGPKVWTWTLASEIAAQGLYNAALADVTALEDRHEGDPGARDEDAARRLGDALGVARGALRDSAKEGEHHRVERVERAVKGEASSPWADRRAVVLVDGGCAGACVALVELLAQLGDGVTLVGTPLDPSASGGRVALYRLPKTRVRVELPTRVRSATPDPAQAAQATALWPSVWVGGGDALSVALRVARGERAPAAPAPE